LEERLPGVYESDAIRTAAKNLKEKMNTVEDALVQINKTAEKDSFNYGGRLNDMFIALLEYVEQADAAPTEATYAVFDYQDQALQQQLTLWNTISKTDVPAFNQLVHDKNVPLLGLPAAAVNGD
jgi:chromatin segregation and condensation protein Rec8/ScpA/Scc1 (kleisin family)